MSLDTVHSAVIKLHSSTEVFNINSLPPELLPNIFKRLKAHDRKNVRLTCRLWNEVCNRREIIEYEKFVFHLGKEGCGFPDFGARIEECEALRSSLEFQCLPLCQLPSNLWANIGERVQSLFIHECEVDGATISNIIIHCIKLKTLHLQSVRYPNTTTTVSDATGEFFTEKGIDKLIECSIERRNLTSLILYSRKASSLSTTELRKLFQIFPSLQKLDRGILIFESTCFELREHRKIEWVSPPTMENFVSNIEDDILNFLKRSNSKLKEFSNFWNLRANPSQYDNFLDFCYKQKELEKLALEVVVPFKEGTDKILFPILRSFPKLKELEFHVNVLTEFWYLPEKLSEFFFLTTKLESIYLNSVLNMFGWRDTPLPVIPLSPLAEYSTLKSLTVTRTINPNFTYEILRRCRTSLHHLKVIEINDEILELILEAHTELKTLDISLNYRRKPNEGGSIPEGKKYPFGKLRNLEYLRLVHINHDILRKSISEFIFPKLRCFEFDCSSGVEPHNYDVALQNWHTMLRVVCKGAPYLETLKIHTSMFKSIDLVDLLRNVQMKCLRYITIYRLIDPHESGYPVIRLDFGTFGSIDAVFNVCTSLFSIRLGCEICWTYFYNRHLKEVKLYTKLQTFDSIETVPTGRISSLRPYSESLIM